MGDEAPAHFRASATTSGTRGEDDRIQSPLKPSALNKRESEETCAEIDGDRGASRGVASTSNEMRRPESAREKLDTANTLDESRDPEIADELNGPDTAGESRDLGEKKELRGPNEEEKPLRSPCEQNASKSPDGEEESGVQDGKAGSGNSAEKAESMVLSEKNESISLGEKTDSRGPNLADESRGTDVTCELTGSEATGKLLGTEKHDELKGVHVGDDPRDESMSEAERRRKQRQHERAQLCGTAFLLAQLRSEEGAQSEKSEGVDFDERKSDASSRKEEDKCSEEPLCEAGDGAVSQRGLVSKRGAMADWDGPKRARLCVEYGFGNALCACRESAAFRCPAPEFGFSVDSVGNNYVRACKWSSDGSVLAAASQDRAVRFFGLRPRFTSLNVDTSVSLGGLIYDMCWHPNVNWLATSSKGYPIHLWNSSGKRCLSFRGINHLDELDSAYSLCFSSDGQFLYGGFNSMIRIFDMNASGRQVSDVPTWTKNFGGQKGIISCIATNPAIRGSYAAGCYRRTVALYSQLSAGAECFFEGNSPGITHLMFSNDGNRLYSAARKESLITCWDLRFPGRVLASLRRPSVTSQRIYFDLDGADRYVFSGSSSGDLCVFDVSTMGSDIIEPSFSLRAHRSALAGVSVHPKEPMVATCSGQRVFPFPRIDDDYLPEDDGLYETTSTASSLDNSLCIYTFAISP